MLRQLMQENKTSLQKIINGVILNKNERINLKGGILCQEVE